MYAKNLFAYQRLKTKEVFTTEGEIVVARVFGFHAAAVSSDIVYFAAALINLFQIHSGRKPSTTHYFDGEPKFQHAAGAKAMGISFLSFTPANTTALSMPGHQSGLHHQPTRWIWKAERILSAQQAT